LSQEKKEDRVFLSKSTKTRARLASRDGEGKQREKECRKLRKKKKNEGRKKEEEGGGYFRERESPVHVGKQIAL